MAKGRIFGQQIIKYFSIRRQLLLALSIILFWVVLCITLIYLRLWSSNYLWNHSERQYKLIKRATEQITESVYQSETLLQSRIMTKTNEDPKLNRYTLQQVEQIWEEKVKPAYDRIERLSKSVNQEKFASLTIDLNKNLDKCFQLLKNAVSSAEKYRNVFEQKQVVDAKSKRSILYNENLDISYTLEIKPYFLSIITITKQLDKENSLLLETRADNYAYNSQLFFGLELIAYILLFISILLAVNNLSRFIKRDISQFEKFTNDLEKGNIPTKIDHIWNEDFLALTTNLNTLRTELGNLQAFATNVQSSFLDQDLKIFGNKGSLGKAFLKMREDLQNTFKQNEIRYWKNNGLAIFNDILRDNASNLNKLAEKFTFQLVDYLNLNQGGFFILVEDEFDSTNQYLELKSSYAYEKKRFLEQQKVLLGQGLIGQVWKEKSTAYYTQIPQNYTHITSGLGETTASDLLIVPMINNEVVQGVIELASLTTIESYKREFVEELAGIMAVTLTITHNNERTQKLLVASQTLAQNLQQQEAKVQKNIQELQKTQSLMNHAQKDLSEKEANLDAVINNTTHAILAFDKDFKITVVNRAMRKMYLANNISLKVGDNLRKSLPEQEWEAHEIEYDRVLSGEKFELSGQVQTPNRLSYLKLHYNPIRNENNEVMGASVFIEDVTSSKQSEIAIKQTEANLKSLINDTEDSIMAIDRHFHLIVANDKFVSQRKSEGFVNIRLGVEILNFYTGKDKEIWQSHFERAFKDERFVIITETGVFPNKFYVEHWFNPIKNEQNEVTGVSVFSKDITESKRGEMKARKVLLESLDTADRARHQEEKLKALMVDYERKIQELEDQVSFYTSNN